MRREFYNFLNELEKRRFNILKFNFYKGKLIVIAERDGDVFVFNYEAKGW